MHAQVRKSVAFLLVAGVALVGASAVFAAASGPNKTLFRYSGRLVVNPAGDATSIAVSVETGNKRALRSLLGHSQVQNFAVGPRTEYLRWTNGIPHVVPIGELVVNDWVTVNVRTKAKSSLDEIEATPAGIVGDRGPTPEFAKQPLFLFTGKLTAAAAAGKVSVHVGAGNRLALRKLLGHSADQTFAYDDETIFLHWQGKVPTVTDAEHLEVGERVVVRIRAPRTSTLDQLEATAAARVAEHEPAAK